MLFDQSHHMVELIVKGPDALKLLSYTDHQQLRQFPGRTGPSSSCRAATTATSSATASCSISTRTSWCSSAARRRVNWMQFHAETGGFNVDIIRDDRSPSHPRGNAVVRRHYRYQIQGPNAAQVIEQAERRADPGHQVLQHGRHQHRGPQGPRPAPRHGRRAGPRDLGPVRRARGDPRRDPRGGQGIRPGAGRLARLRHQHARVGLDSLAAAGRLHRREA